MVADIDEVPSGERTARLLQAAADHEPAEIEPREAADPTSCDPATAGPPRAGSVRFGAIVTNIETSLRAPPSAWQNSRFHRRLGCIDGIAHSGASGRRALTRDRRNEHDGTTALPSRGRWREFEELNGAKTDRAPHRHACRRHDGQAHCCGYPSVRRPCRILTSIRWAPVPKSINEPPQLPRSRELPLERWRPKPPSRRFGCRGGAHCYGRRRPLRIRQSDSDA